MPPRPSGEIYYFAGVSALGTKKVIHSLNGYIDVVLQVTIGTKGNFLVAVMVHVVLPSPLVHEPGRPHAPADPVQLPSAA
jgi:hypothetical protein